MIDEKKLIEKLNKITFEAEVHNSGYKGTRTEKMLLYEDVMSIINNQPKVGEWIPVSKPLSKIRKDCLVTAKYTGFMGMYGSWVQTGHLEDDGKWWGSCMNGGVVV